MGGETIDLTKPAVAKEKATWGPAERIDITDEGLGWDGMENSSYDGWILTAPVAVGLSWRPLPSFSVQVEMPFSAKEEAWAKDGKYPGWPGNLFARFSPDGVHWSTWQAMAQADGQRGRRKYAGELGAPERERIEYLHYLREYQKLDVPWKSDEEALVAWILKKEPDFFAHHLPFVGYVQLLWEGSFRGGRRFPSLTMSTGFGISGAHYPARDSEAQRDRHGPWRFKAPQTGK